MPNPSFPSDEVEFDRARAQSEIDDAYADRDYDEVIRVVQRYRQKMMRDGFAYLLVQWLKPIPTEVLLENPELVLVLGQASGLAGDITTARAVSLALHASLDMLDESMRPAMRVGIARIDVSILTLSGDFGRYTEVLSALGDVSLIDDSMFAVTVIDRGAIDGSLALGHLLRGEFDDAIATARRVLVPSEILPPTRSALTALGVISVAYAWNGDEAEARRAVREAMFVLDRFHGQCSGQLLIYVAALWVSDDVDLAAVLDEANDHARRLGYPGARLAVAVGAVRMLLRRGLPSRAAEWLDVANEEASLMIDPAYFDTVRRELRAELAGHDHASSTLLTEAEIQCLSAIARGGTRSDAAEQLGYSVNTVKSHLRHTYAKLGAVDRDDAVEKAKLLGLIAAE